MEKNLGINSESWDGFKAIKIPKKATFLYFLLYV